jgi:YVTN family beta-propeller protein
MGRTLLYVSNFQGVSVIDTAINEVVATIPLADSGASTAAPDGRRVYLGGGDPYTISVIGTTTNTVVAKVNLGSPHIVERGVVAPDGKHAYFSTDVPRAGGPLDLLPSINIKILETATEIVAANGIEVDQVGYASDVAMSANGKFIYFACSGAVVVLDTTLNQVVAKIVVPAAGVSVLKGIAITPDSKHAYVTDNFDQISVLDLTNNTVIAKVKLPVGTGDLGNISMSPDGARAYFIAYGAIVIVNTATNTMIGSISLPNPNPTTTAITPDGKTIYAGGGNNSNIYAVDVATSAVTATITLAVDSMTIVATPA